MTSSEGGPVLSLISKRFRSLRKKLQSKPSVAAVIHELEKLRLPLVAAVADEIRLATSPEGAAVNGLRIPKDISLDNYLKSQRNENIPSNKKRKSLHNEATVDKAASTDTNENRSPKKAHLHVPTMDIASTIDKSNIDGSLSKPTNAPGKIHKLKNNATANEESDSDGIENQITEQNLSHNRNNLEFQSHSSQEKKEVASQQPKKGALWAQKSSWTNLVGETNASFSITQLLPDTKFEYQEQIQQSKNWFAAKPTVDEPRGRTVVNPASGAGLSDVGLKASQGVVTKGKAVGAPVRYVIGETCSFMRTDASIKEWKTTKAALSVSLKKKIDRNK